jgi:hypothetical protein
MCRYGVDDVNQVPFYQFYNKFKSFNNTSLSLASYPKKSPNTRCFSFTAKKGAGGIKQITYNLSWTLPIIAVASGKFPFLKKIAPDLSATRVV